MSGSVPMTMGEIAAVIFLILLLGGLVWSFLEQQKGLQSARPVEGTTVRASPSWLAVVCGAAIGAILGSLLFWPSLFGARLDIEAIRHFTSKGGDDFQAFVVPWIIKTLVCTGIGGALGFAWRSLTATTVR